MLRFAQHDLLFETSVVKMGWLGQSPNQPIFTTTPYIITACLSERNAV
jgi:hypothetical protein